MSGQHTQWWLQDRIIAYASSKDGCANKVISKAQFDNALPKNRMQYDVPLGRLDRAEPNTELATARALLAAVIENENASLFGPDIPNPDVSYRIRAFLKGGAA